MEIYFSIVQRKLLTPNDFEASPSLPAPGRVRAPRSEVAEPFKWNFTRADLAELMERLSVREPQLRLAA